MKKILIIGCGGAGKSYFAKELQKILNIELIHLDKLYRKPVLICLINAIKKIKK